MKVIANGGLNFSVLDGWWCEGFDPELGWSIGNGEEYSDSDYQDEVEARQLYHTLENDIIPLFYQRQDDRLPRNWITKVKSSMKKLGPVFNTQRMVLNYFDKYYLPAFDKKNLLLGKGKEKVKALTEWKDKLKKNWNSIKIISTEAAITNKTVFVNEEYPVNAEIYLGDLTPGDVEVQLYYGPLDKTDNPHFYSTVVMKNSSNKTTNGNYNYVGKIICAKSGQTGFTIRILPKNNLLINQFELGLVSWAQ